MVTFDSSGNKISVNGKTELGDGYYDLSMGTPSVGSLIKKIEHSTP